MNDAERAAQVAEEKLLHLADARPPEFSDEALAERFATAHEGAVCYVAAWSQWHTFDGTRWRKDDTLSAFDKARAICRATAAEAEKLNIKMGLTSAKTVAACERLAKTDRRVAATVDQWDAVPGVFNEGGDDGDD